MYDNIRIIIKNNYTKYKCSNIHSYINSKINNSYIIVDNINIIINKKSNYIKYKFINIHSYINSKINNSYIMVNNIYNYFINKKNIINNYITTFLYSNLNKNEEMQKIK